MTFQIKKIPYLLILILITLSFLLIRFQENFVLFTDELIIEEVSYRMAQTGNLTIPIFQNQVWLEKPPLYLWLNSFLYRIFSPLPFVRRLWPGVFSLLLIYLIYIWGKLFLTPNQSFLAALIGLTNYYFLNLSKSGNFDLAATFFLMFALYCYLEGERKKIAYLLFGVSFGLAILTRSFLVLVPLPIIFFDLIYQAKKPRFWQNKNWLAKFKFIVLGLLITLVIILPWHLKAALSHPQEFVSQYLLFNSSDRFKADFAFKKDPLSPHPLFYLIYFALATPIFLFLPFILVKELLNFSCISRPRRFLTLWCLIFFLPLIISGSLTPWYLLQIIPAASLLTVAFLSQLKTHPNYLVSQLRKYFLLILVLVSLVNGPLLFFANHDLSALTIKVSCLSNRIAPGKTLYSWKINYFLSTIFFEPNQKVVVVNPENLNQILGQNEKILIFIPPKEIGVVEKSAHLEKIDLAKDNCLYWATKSYSR